MKLWSISRYIIHAVVVSLLVSLCVCVSAQQDNVELSGILAYPDGTPSVGVKVKIGIGRSISPSATCFDYVEATTDSNGRYSKMVKSGPCRIKAEFGDYLVDEDITVGPDGKVAGNTSPVAKIACLVLGEVTDAFTGAAIEGAGVHIYGSYGADTKSAADGTFKLKTLPLSGLMLQVEKSGYVTRRINFNADDSGSLAFRVALRLGGVVRGRVVYEAGEPVVGAAVEIIEDQVYARSTKTDEDGNYELRNLDTDIQTRISVEVNKTGLSEWQSVVFAKGSKEARANFTLKKSATETRTISGRVVDGNGAPVAGAAVIYGMSTCAWNRKETSTDSDGTYKLTGISARRDMILVQAKSYAPAFLPVDEGSDLTIDGRLVKGHSAGGVITDRAGNPLSDVHITVNAKADPLAKIFNPEIICGGDVYRWLYTAKSDSLGKFSLEDLPAKGVVIDASEKDHALPWNTPIKVDSSDNVIVMRGRPVVAGQVADASSGTPLHGFTVMWGDSYRDNAVYNQPDGTFKVVLDDDRFLDQKEYQVKVEAKGYLAEEKTIKVTESPAVDYSNVFKMRKTISAMGKVTDALGKAVEGASVTIVEKGGLDSHWIPPKIQDLVYQIKATTGKDGSFLLNSVREQVADVLVEKEGFPALAMNAVDLSKPVRITLPNPASLQIKATRFIGDSANVSLSLEKDRYTMDLPPKQLSVDGRALYSGLEAGAYHINIYGKKLSASRVVKLAPGANMTLDLDAKQPAIVKGKVTRNGKPVSDIKVIIDRGPVSTFIYHGNCDTCTTDSEGWFEISTDQTGSTDIEYYSFSGQCSKRVMLKLGENAVELALPTGVVKGKVIDAETGEPLKGEHVLAMAKWLSPARKNYTDTLVEPSWGRTQGSTETAADGSFTLNDLPGGEIVIMVGEVLYGLPHPKYISRPIVVNENKPVTGVTLTVQEPGEIDLSVVDADTGKALIGGSRSVVTLDGVDVPSRSNYHSPGKLQPGRYAVWVSLYDGRHLPAYAQFEVKSGKTAKVRMPLRPVEQRIVFRIIKDGKFGSLINQSVGGMDLKAWIGFSLSDAVTGKPVLVSSQGLEWGGCLELYGQAEAAVPIKPGTYLLDAILRDTNDYSVGSKVNLWQVYKKIAVRAGQDAVIDVK